jgi:dihydrodipicolinate synthase/N-acetylneuraminate lyase
MALEFTKLEAKAWARKNYKGLDGTIAPSFTPDLSELDEEGIRWDVQHNIRKGMFSVLCETMIGVMTFDERKRFMEIVCHEAKGKILVSVTTGIDDVDQDIALLRHFEKVGGTHVLFGYPSNFYAKSEEDIYQITRKICDAVDLCIDLWPKPIFDFGRFHPSAFNPHLVARIAEIPNVVSAKIYIADGFGKMAQVHHLVGDQILQQSGEPEEWPITIPKYGQQWAGPGKYVIYDPEDATDTRIVKLFNLFRNGEFDKAMDLYWQLSPVHMNAMKVGLYQSGGGYVGIKYLDWLAGGNGGQLRQPGGRLPYQAREAMRAGIKAIGINPRDDDEEFWVGRVNYARGIRSRK